jgi:hypothetical protein
VQMAPCRSQATQLGFIEWEVRHGED